MRRRAGTWSRAWTTASRPLRAGLLLALVAGCATSPTPAPGTAAATGAIASPVVAASPAATQDPAASPLPPPAATTPPVAQEPTSVDRILEARDAGSLDEPTALLYRVYAIFGDPRLPAEYASTTWDEDGGALAEAALQIDTLPPEVAAELRPYLARPTDPSSVFHGSGAIGMVPGTAVLAMARPAPAHDPDAPAAVVCDRATNWGYIDGAEPWRVWGPCNGPSDPQLIEEAADAVADLWPDLTAFMGPPIPDAGGPDEAGDGRIDIYLVSQCVSRAGRCLWWAGNQDSLGVATVTSEYRGSPGSRASSGFIRISSSAFGTSLRSALAHELFHVLEYAHNVDGPLAGGWHWFVEASAKWSEWYFVPGTRGTEVYPWFATYQGSSFGLQSTTGNNEYASYVWPLFMEQERGAAAIQAAWAAIDGLTDHRGITAVINRQLPFATNYRELAVRAWNEILRPGNPIPKRLQALDPTLPEWIPFGRRITVTGRLPANPHGTLTRRIPESIQSLYSRYAQFDVDDDVGQITLDFSALAPIDALDVDLLLKIRDTGWERRKLSTGSTRLCRNVDEDRVDQMIVVLSNHDIDSRLFVEGDWTIESLKEPCIGYEVKITWTDSYAGVLDTITFQGTIDAFDTEAPGDGAFLTGTGTAVGSRPGWKGCNPGIEDTPSGLVRAEFGAQIIGDTVTISGWAGFDTALSGVVTGAFTLPVDGGTARIEPGPLFGDLCPRTSFGTIEVKRFEKLAP
jgi:hypothetical protein